MLEIHNSLTGKKAEFKPLRGNEVRMYVCGITVYDYIHLGHARMLTVFDLVQRYLRSRGYAVTYVRNITDIDDKIIQRATENGEDWKALASRFIDRHARGLRAARPASARRRAARHRVHPRDRGDDANAHRQGIRLPGGERRCHVLGAQVPGLRRALGKTHRRIARRRARTDRRVQARSARLRGVEARQAGRARMALAVGPRPAGLAHRMLRDVDDAARRLLRPARRGHGPEISASRERDRSDPARRAARRSCTSGCTTASSTSTRRRCRSRSATSSRCAMC